MSVRHRRYHNPVVMSHVFEQCYYEVNISGLAYMQRESMRANTRNAICYACVVIFIARVCTTRARAPPSEVT